MTLTPDEAKLVERLQGFVDACSGHDITLYEGHPAVLVDEAASALIRIAEGREALEVERDAGRAVYLTLQQSMAVLVKKLEAAESLAAQALRERDEAREALKWFAEMASDYDPDEGDDADLAWLEHPKIGWLRAARRALSEQPDKERMP